MVAHSRRCSTGFTLIELMVTVAVIGILSAIAYPSYQAYLKKGRRVDAKVSLMNAAQAMERYFSENMSYASATAGTVFLTTSQDGNYTIGFDTGSPTTNAYTIKAAPTGRQTGDACGTYTLSNAGAQGVTGGSLSASECW